MQIYCDIIEEKVDMEGNNLGKRKNSTIKERKALLKELGLTAEDMVKFWEDCKKVNKIIMLLDKEGKTWEDLTVYQIRQLPTLLEKHEEKIRQEEEKDKLEKELKAYNEYYNEHFEEIMVKNIDNKETLTEGEIKRLVYNYEVVSDYGENRRWSRSVSTIVSICDRYFCIDWEQGLTECQENEFYNQPYEVEKHEEEKTIIITTWNKKGEN